MVRDIVVVVRLFVFQREVNLLACRARRATARRDAKPTRTRDSDVVAVYRFRCGSNYSGVILSAHAIARGVLLSRTPGVVVGRRRRLFGAPLTELVVVADECAASCHGAFPALGRLNIVARIHSCVNLVRRRRHRRQIHTSRRDPRHCTADGLGRVLAGTLAVERHRNRIVERDHDLDLCHRGLCLVRSVEQMRNVHRLDRAKRRKKPARRASAPTRLEADKRVAMASLPTWPRVGIHQETVRAKIEHQFDGVDLCAHLDRSAAVCGVRHGLRAHQIRKRHTTTKKSRE